MEKNFQVWSCITILCFSCHRDTITRITHLPKVSHGTDDTTDSNGAGRYVSVSREGTLHFWTMDLMQPQKTLSVSSINIHPIMWYLWNVLNSLRSWRNCFSACESFWSKNNTFPHQNCPRADDPAGNHVFYYGVPYILQLGHEAKASKNVWITDCVVLPNAKKFALSTADREIGSYQSLDFTSVSWSQLLLSKVPSNCSFFLSFLKALICALFFLSTIAFYDCSANSFDKQFVICSLDYCVLTMDYW